MKILRSLHYLRKLPSVSNKQQLKVLCNRCYRNNIINTSALAAQSIVHFSSISSETLTTTEATSLLSSSTTDQQQQINHENPKTFAENRSFENIWLKLNAFYKMNGFICNEQLQPLLDFMEKHNPGRSTGNDRETFLSKNQQLFLLQVVGFEMPLLSPTERIHNFQLIWKYLEESCPINTLSPEHYHVMLEVYRRNRLALTDYHSLLTAYERIGGNIKSEIIYRKILEVAGACGDVSMGTTLLAEMRTLRLPLDEHAYNSLLMANGRIKDKNGLQSVYDTMLATGVSIGIKTQTTLALLAIENDQRELFNSILLRFKGNFSIDDILRMLESIPRVKYLSWCESVVETLIKEFPKEYAQQPEIPFSLRRICMEMLHNE